MDQVYCAALSRQGFNNICQEGAPCAAFNKKSLEKRNDDIRICGLAFRARIKFLGCDVLRWTIQYNQISFINACLHIYEEKRYRYLYARVQVRVEGCFVVTISRVTSSGSVTIDLSTSFVVHQLPIEFILIE